MSEVGVNEDPSKRRLGRGLAALIGHIDQPQEQASVAVPRPDNKVPIEFVVPNPKNPRRAFAEDDLTDLAQSIREHGIVQPVVVRPAPLPGKYEIIAGERRWRAAQRAGLNEIPVIIRDVSDRTALEIAIVENVQRSDLNPVEEALGYQQLIDDHSYTQADLGNVIGKSRSHVANTLRLLKLPNVIRDMIVSGQLSAGHARTLVTAADPAGLAKRIISEGLSVRQAEALAQMDERKAPPVPKAPKEADVIALEKLLADVTGLHVAIRSKGTAGEVRVSYKSLDEFDEICRLLKSSVRA
jgi:ParB family transcriptional regulator, chromosome partitioning protein